MRILKRIGLVLLVVAMMYASNWDVPKETKADWEREHWEALQVYAESKGITHENHVEKWEAWGGPLPTWALEGGQE